MEQSQTKIRADSRPPTARPWRVVTLATKRAKNHFCVRKFQALRVSRFSILIRTPPGLNERKTKVMKLYIPSKQIITPTRRPLTPGNRNFSRRGFLGAGMTLAAAGVFAAKAGDRSTSEPGPDVQVSILHGEQACLRGRLVAGSDGPRTSYLKIHGRREYETHGRRGA